MILILSQNIQTANSVARSRRLALHEWFYILTAAHLGSHNSSANTLLIEPGWEQGRDEDIAFELYKALNRTNTQKEYVLVD